MFNPFLAIKNYFKIMNMKFYAFEYKKYLITLNDYKDKNFEFSNKIRKLDYIIFDLDNFVEILKDINAKESLQEYEILRSENIKEISSLKKQKESTEYQIGACRSILNQIDGKFFKEDKWEEIKKSILN